MDLHAEVEELSRRLAELKKQYRKLFANQVELKINLQLLQEEQERRWNLTDEIFKSTKKDTDLPL
jgi:Holliday junction resolvase RusA-like endonuclease